MLIIAAMFRAVGWAMASVMLVTVVTRAGAELLRDSVVTAFATTVILCAVLIGALTLGLWAAGRAVAAGREFFERDQQR